MRLFPNTVRWRLALWYALSLALIFSAFSAVLFFAVRTGCLQPVRAQLDAEFSLAERALRRQSFDAAALELAVPYLRIMEHGHTIHTARSWTLASAAGAKDGDGYGVRESVDGRHYYVREAAVQHDGRTVQLAVGVDIEQSYNSLLQLVHALLIGFPGILLASLAIGYVFAGRVLSPVDAMARKARKITAEKLSERLPVKNREDEFGYLASAFNEVFERLEASFENMRRFTADASHELRTPLTVLRSVGENALRQRQTPEGYEEAIGSMLEETERLARLLDDLLMLARADARQHVLRVENLDLAELAADVVNCLRILAEEKCQDLQCSVDQGVIVPADRILVRQAMMNLVANAIRYSPAYGRIRVCVHYAPDGAGTIEVHDNGPGIADRHKRLIFERFYRIDPGRSKETGGVGLGLAIARAAVALNGGRIEVESEENRGSIFRIVLPAHGYSGRIIRETSTESPNSCVR